LVRRAGRAQGRGTLPGISLFARRQHSRGRTTAPCRLPPGSAANDARRDPRCCPAGNLGLALMGAAEPTITRRKRAMSAVPPELPRASADSTEHTTEHSGPESQAGVAGPDFGANEWLVDELYQRYLADPSSVAMEWWNFFADYQPPAGSSAQPAAAPPAAARPAPSRAGPPAAPGSPAPPPPGPAAPGAAPPPPAP